MIKITDSRELEIDHILKQYMAINNISKKSDAVILIVSDYYKMRDRLSDKITLCEKYSKAFNAEKDKVDSIYNALKKLGL